MAKLSILGLYRYNDKLFDTCSFPSNIDRDRVIHNILLNAEPFEIIYPNWTFMQFALEEWCLKNFDIWEKLAETLNYEYDPIANKDATIKETTTRNLANTSVEKGTGNSSGTNNSTDIDSTKGFNSSNWAEHDKSVISSGNTSKYNNDLNKKGTDTGTITLERTEKGNIGVMSTQELIQRQRDIVQFNIYDYILDDFKKRFCVLVY